MSDIALWVFAYAFIAVVLHYIYRNANPRAHLIAAGIYVAFMLADAAFQDWKGVIGDAFLVLFQLWEWWNKRKKIKKRAAELLGAKSRALRDALVKKMRQLPRTRIRIPDLSPAPA